MPEQTTQNAQTMVEVKNGFNKAYVPAGTTVQQVRKNQGQRLTLKGNQAAMLADGRTVGEDYQLQPGDQLVFAQPQHEHAR